MPINNQQISDWLILVQDAQLKECLDQLCNLLPELTSTQKERAISLAARVSTIRDREQNDLAEYGDIAREMNKIRHSLIQLLEDLRKEKSKIEAQNKVVVLADNEFQFQEYFSRVLAQENEAYTDLKCISSGDYSLIYKALKNAGTPLEEQVAIKVFKNFSLIEEENQSEIKERFSKSYKLSKVDGIITMLKIQTKELPRYYVMPLIHGMTLTEYLKKDWPFHIREIKKMLLRITTSLKVGHDSEVYHLNLNPTNIMIDREGSPWLFPFQVTRFNLSSQSLSRIKKVVAYWAPEQINGGILNHKTDQYALGLVIFELFKHKPLFRGKTVLQILKKRALIDENPALIQEELATTDCPPSFIPVVQKMLRLQPKDRYASLEKVWDEILNMEAPYSSSEVLERLMLSFSRCRKKKGFYQDFYQLFFQLSPKSKAIFQDMFQKKARTSKLPEHTLWEYQHQMLDLSIDRLLHFHANPKAIQQRLSKLIENHRAFGTPIEDFTLFFDALKTAITKHDPLSWQEDTSDLEDLWEVIIAPFLDYLKPS